MKALLKDIYDILIALLLFVLVWCIVGFSIGISFGIGHRLMYQPTTIILKETVTDTIYIRQYVDTCDSQFMRAIIETECHGYSKIQAGKDFYPPIGDGGRAIGIWQMHESYFDCGLAEALNYKYEDMMRPDKSFHVFWAKMGIYTEWFRHEYGRLPTHEELARMHNGSRRGHNKESTIVYRNKFRKNFNTQLNGNLHNKLD